MYGPNDTLDTDSYYEPDEDDQEQWYLDAGYYDGPDPDLARDLAMELEWQWEDEQREYALNMDAEIAGREGR